MNYAYTSARVRSMETLLPTPELIRSLADAKDIDECISVLNGAGFEGRNTAEIVAALKAHREKLIGELIEDTSEIEVIFYEKNFHNLKAAIKEIYSRGGGDMYYKDATVSGEAIAAALKSSDEQSLPKYMSKIAGEAYRTLLRTGDGRLSDMMVDKACLEAMADFAAKTKHNVLKSYVNERIAAADIQIARRAGDNDEMLSYIVPCEYFSAESLIKAVKDNVLDDFIEALGFEEDPEKRMAQLTAKEKYNIFTSAPAINFILEYDRAISIIRYVLICIANGTDKERIMRRLKDYV